jgi:hypothetical protein
MIATIQTPPISQATTAPIHHIFAHLPYNHDTKIYITENKAGPPLSSSFAGFHLPPATQPTGRSS